MTNRSMCSDVANDMADDLYGDSRVVPYRYDRFNETMGKTNRIAWAFRHQEEHQ